MGDGKSETLLRVYVSNIVLRRGIETRIALRIDEYSFKCSVRLLFTLVQRKSRLSGMVGHDSNMLSNASTIAKELDVRTLGKSNPV